MEYGPFTNFFSCMTSSRILGWGGGGDSRRGGSHEKGFVPNLKCPLFKRLDCCVLYGGTFFSSLD